MHVTALRKDAIPLGSVYGLRSIQPQEQPTLPIHSTRSASSGSSQLVGGASPSSRGSGSNCGAGNT